MKTRVRTVRLENGDVRVFKIVRRRQVTRLAIYDEDRAVPLIQAHLSAIELAALRRALGTEE